jgi:hypothetical protein
MDVGRVDRNGSWWIVSSISLTGTKTANQS